MAKVAKPIVNCSSTSEHSILMKRKTPSQLREEQLKRRIMSGLAHDPPASVGNTDVLDSENKKPEGPRNTRYVDMRLDEVYPARKPTSRVSLLSVKSNLKENQVIEEKGRMKNCSLRLASKNRQELKSISASVASAKANVSQQCQTAEDSEAKFRSVAELSFGSDRFAQLSSVDMDKALKGLSARETSGSSSPTFGGNSGDVKSKFLSEMHIPGSKIPIDFTLKTTMRIVSSSPVDKFHRLLMGGTHSGMSSFSVQSSFSGCQNFSYKSTSQTSSNLFSLHSWIYPQSSLPPSVMSVLSSSKGGGEMDFLNKRQLAWEDSFRCLYYSLRKNGCNIFYVCTSQFVVIFTAVGGMGKSKRTCNAYISQSTRGLRSLLKEHDICFSMPSGCYEMEEISREDLVELSEIEKHNLGQTKRNRSMPDVDNSPKSLLAFNGNDSVHGLYDFLLNYRSLLTMLTSVDVPVLCAPFPFLNAALSSPEVRCKEIKRADALLSKPSAEGESIDASKSGIYYNMEIKDTYLPPWVVSSVCAAMGSDGRVFETSFVTEPNSIGLNAALEAADIKCDSDETSGDSQQLDNPFGISAAIVSTEMVSASLKSLKYSNGSYLASLSPV